MWVINRPPTLHNMYKADLYYSFYKFPMWDNEHDKKLFKSLLFGGFGLKPTYRDKNGLINTSCVET